MEERTECNARTRMKVSTTAKGTAQWEVSVEYDTPELAERNLLEAVKRVRDSIASLGLKEASA